MASLQRSTLSYRREGSSGAVWGDKLLPELVLEKDRIDPTELRHCYSAGGRPAMLNEKNHSSSDAAAVMSPVYNRSSSLSASALKLLNPKTVGQKFKGVVGNKPPKYGKHKPLVVRA